MLVSGFVNPELERTSSLHSARRICIVVDFTHRPPAHVSSGAHREGPVVHLYVARSLVDFSQETKAVLQSKILKTVL